jgi:hypothetical protein
LKNSTSGCQLSVVVLVVIGSYSVWLLTLLVMVVVAPQSQGLKS